MERRGHQDSIAAARSEGREVIRADATAHEELDLGPLAAEPGNRLSIDTPPLAHPPKIQDQERPRARRDGGRGE